jgi:signal transduction histidine kinase
VHTAQSVAEVRLRQSLAASEQERRRWARELHDETLQSLGALQVILSSALARGSPDSLEAAVRDAISQISSEIGNLRNLITELRPASLDDLGLAAAIEGLAERTSTVEGIAVETRLDLAVDGEPHRLAPQLETTIYRLVQEALTNVAKHAVAEHVQVEVRMLGGAVEVEVRDDGVGFDPQSATDGFGLIGMRERTELAGGSLEIGSTAGEGTTVRATLPVEQA